ncbi:MAG: S9 family peptidase [Candidatus Glassbacteria bacterium]|nr:S9 family peptidase [Candidatus Glassbacteria bacterium]
MALAKTIKLLAALAVCAGPVLAQGRPLEFEDLLRVKRLSEPAVSPDGKWVAYVQTSHDPETCASWSEIYLVPLAGGEPRLLTSGKNSNSRPLFTPDGLSLVFASNRSGNRQFYLLPLYGGGEAVQLTHQPGGTSGGRLSPDGRHLLYHADVLVDSASVVGYQGPGTIPRARIIDELLFRHWDHWRNGEYKHVFITRIGSEQPPLDLTPGKLDAPPISLGSSQDYASGPGGRYVYYVANRDPVVTVSTNNDIWRVTTGGDSLLQLTNNPANDNLAAVSPGGSLLAYRAMARARFEADRYCLMLRHLETGEEASLTAELDRSVGEVAWGPDEKYLYFTAEDEGKVSVFRVAARLRGETPVQRLTDAGSYSGLCVAPDGKTLVALRESFTRPAELVALDAGGKGPVRELTALNASLLSNVEMNQAESFYFEAEDGVRVHGYLIRPPGFDPSVKYPLIYLIHGGPQGAWTDEFHYRWNAQAFASWGYVAAMVNPHGSTGYGQQLTDQISGDWGGKCYRDLMRGVDYLLENYSFIDPERLGAAGASFGGYMINWIEGHTDRFKCLVNHDGVFNLESEYGSTEELWFPEWEFGGPLYQNPTLYRIWSPHRHAANFKTPMLIIHGEKDYRVPPEQGLMAFTILQRMDIESRLLYFPDEGHWVLDPENSRLWYKTIRDWFDRFLMPCKAPERVK